jgi:hypothetical protein
MENNEEGRVVVSTTPASIWSVHERFGHLGINAPIQIPQTGVAVPQSLWSLEGATRYGRRLDGDRSCGISLSVGSDSDRLFHSIHETIMQASADYRIPSGERNGWLFFLGYSNNRYFLNGVPLPGVSYMFRSESGKVQGIVGFPFFSLRYSPVPIWDARLSAFGPRRLNMDVGRRMRGMTRVHAGFDWGGQTWLRAGRTDNASRLSFERKRLYAGVETPLPYRMSLALSGGREFDRRFFETASAFSTGGATATLSPAWYLEAEVSWRFGAGGNGKRADNPGAQHERGNGPPISQ